MASFGASTGATTTGSPASIGPTDCNVPLAGDDGILSLNWSSKEDRLVSTNWDGGVRIWDVQEEQVGGVVGQQQVVRAIPRAKVTHDKLPNGFNSPVFDSVFSEDGSTVFSVGGDKAVRMWPLGRALPPNNIATQIGVHEAPAKAVGFLPSCSNLVVSGGWDRKLKFWDTRSPNPAGVFEMPERIHSLDVRGNLMVVITAGRHVLTYNVGGPLPQEQSRIESPLAHQSRCVSCFPDQIGFAIGSIGGRVRFQYLREEKKAVESFSFRCHRQVPGHAYSVNAIAFHPNGRVFATAGSDGGVSFWDKDKKTRLKEFPAIQRTIPCAAFNARGNLFAYASSYDWSKGGQFHAPGTPNEIYIHYTPEEELNHQKKQK